jgi:DNA-binding HxlR family transcriptional regulator
MAKKLARTFGCPIEFTLHVLGGKWTSPALGHLALMQRTATPVQ